MRPKGIQPAYPVQSKRAIHCRRRPGEQRRYGGDGIVVLEDAVDLEHIQILKDAIWPISNFSSRGPTSLSTGTRAIYSRTRRRFRPIFRNILVNEAAIAVTKSVCQPVMKKCLLQWQHCITWHTAAARSRGRRGYGQTKAYAASRLCHRRKCSAGRHERGERQHRNVAGNSRIRLW